MKNNNKKEKAGKKKGGSLSSREKKLLFGTLGVAVLVGYLLTANHLYQKNQQLAEEKMTVEQEVDTKLAKINQLPKLEKQRQELSTDVLREAERYYGTVNQGEFIYLIDHFIKESKISLESVSFAETTDLNFVEPKLGDSETTSSSSESSSTSSSSSDSAASSSETTINDPAASSSEAPANDSAASSSTTVAGESIETKYQNTNITQMTASIEFEGTYTQIIKLLELVDQNDKKIVSSELKLDGEDEIMTIQKTDPPLKGTILLRFYQVEDVARYVSPPPSQLDKVDIKPVVTTSPFMWPEWRGVYVGEKGGDTGSNSNNQGGNSNTTSLSNPTFNNPQQNPGLGNSGFVPQYLNQLQPQNQGGNNLSAYFQSATIYKFETPLSLVKTSDGSSTPVEVDTADFKEGTGSNLIAMPVSSEATHYEMLFPENAVQINEQPSNISFAMSTSVKWQGKLGLIVTNAAGQDIYVEIVMPDSWSGWREVSFAPTNISGLSYPLKIKGFYFETPSSASDGTTIKIDNLAVHQLKTN